MTDEVFRIIIAVAVGLACIMVIVQAFVMVGLLKVVRKVEQRVDSLVTRAEPAVSDVGKLVAKLGPMLEDASPMMAKIGPTFEKLGPMVEKMTVAFESVGPVAVKVGGAVEQVKKVLASANLIIDDARPRISEVSDEVAAISHSGRQQVERWGEFLEDAGDRARNRLEQIDHSVEHTVDQVGQVGETMKRTVMRPVREVNGIAAGISAAVATLVKKPRKYSVDSATQDEEMFI